MKQRKKSFNKETIITIIVFLVIVVGASVSNYLSTGCSLKENLLKGIREKNSVQLLDVYYLSDRYSKIQTEALRVMNDSLGMEIEGSSIKKDFWKICEIYSNAEGPDNSLEVQKRNWELQQEGCEEIRITIIQNKEVNDPQISVEICDK